MRRPTRILLALLAGLLLLLLAGPFLIPLPALEGLSPPQALADPDSRFVPVPLGAQSLTLHVKERGAGEPAFVLLHGFGASLFSWRAVLEPLAERGRVVAFDRPAFGLTQRPVRGEWGTAADWRARNPYSAEAQVALTVGLMDELGIEQAVLVGNSAGGGIAMRTALDHPERVTGLILISPAVYTGGGSPAWARPLLALPQMQRAGPLLARRIQSWGLDFARAAWHDPARLDAAAWEGYRRPLDAEDWDVALWELTAASRPLGLPERLNDLTLPVLVITGDDDRIVPTAESVRLADELPNATLSVIPACGHVAHEECPAQTLDALTRWLESL